MKTIQGLETAESATAETRGESKPSTRILVVDEDVCLRQLSLEVLARSGYDVDAAEDAAAGWAALNTDTYDLVITDNSRPKQNGIELLKKLRAARMALPFIMTTATPPAPEIVESPWLIPDATLLKPFTTDELVGKVKDILCMNDSTPSRPAPTSAGLRPDR